ncbi:class I SAM-dependent methyltransferase [Fodinicola feengrottensis]|uniref:class I SAM-dependent methyltransferase n=1 Tax=Fodinicola feengrottensis TaxID=435914 RepID=UPI002442F189|nr:class I SAM-dependent methyltransferase [Fodinicola feengrottensis]
MFIRRADRQITDPIGATHQQARAALTEPGTVLDVGAAAGATSLPLAGRAAVTAVTAIDTDTALLNAYATRATNLELPARCLRAGWPDAAVNTEHHDPTAGLTADVVLVGNVLYNIADLPPFIHALTRHARRTVIVEIADQHPLTDLNPYWRHFHGIDRPTGPTVADAITALAELGIHPRVHRWSRPPEAEHATWTDLVEVTCRRLCLPPEASADVDTVLRRSGIDPQLPPDLGSSGRELTTLVWDGTA